nr:PepSY domain-containing protein [Streptomyces sp. Xyl84]
MITTGAWQPCVRVKTALLATPGALGAGAERERGGRSRGRPGSRSGAGQGTEKPQVTGCVGRWGGSGGGSVSASHAGVTHSGMTTALRIPPLRSIVAICALGGSALLMTACSNGSTGSSVAEAAEASPTSASATAPSSPSPSASLTKDQAERRDLLAQTHVSWDKAADTAVKEVSGGKLVSIELKNASHHSTSSPGMATSPGAASPSPASPGAASPGAASPSPASPGAGTGSPSPSAGAAEWETKVAAADGTVHRVDVDAATGKVSRKAVESDQDAGDKRKVADRLKKATRTPAQAVQTATGRTKGTVTGVDLDEHDNKLVWAVDVVTPKDWHKTTYDIDVANGNVVREHVDSD